MSFPTLDEAVACNEAVREPAEVSQTPDDADLDRVERALVRAQIQKDAIDAAASLAHELTAAQGFYEGNKRTALLWSAGFIAENTDRDPDALIPPDDRRLGDLLIAAARGERVGDEIRALLTERPH